MGTRNLIKINEALCNGCGNCIIACAEGAIRLANGKATVISDKFCDGLGACIGSCPEGALSIEKREADEFTEKVSEKDQNEIAEFEPCIARHLITMNETSLGTPLPVGKSQLNNWPIQMRLVRPNAPYLKGDKLLIAADCTGFAYSDIHRDFIRGRVTIVGCPKLDDQGSFVDKLTRILKDDDIEDITILHMTVPCCAQLNDLVNQSMKEAGKDLPIKSCVVGIRGDLEIS